MTAIPKSFRLTPTARKNLDKLAAGYELSATMVINILLTGKSRDPLNSEDNLCAHNVLEEYFEDKLLRHIETSSPHVIHEEFDIPDEKE